MSDINPEYGHTVVDMTKMSFREEFDGVLCANVLEHVWELGKAVSGVHEALRPGGRALVTVPMLYPLHDEPADYWRISEHALPRLLVEFDSVDVQHRGIRVLLSRTT